MISTDFRLKLRGNTAPIEPDEKKRVPDGIVLDRENDVVRHGYRSAVDQINELTRAGINLALSREDRYAVPTGINARHYGEVDMTIAREKLAALQTAAQERTQAAQKAAEEKAAQKKAETEAAPKAAPTTPQAGGVT